MENWKTILALTVFILPLAYCEIQRTEDESAVKIACIEKRGDGVMALATSDDVDITDTLVYNYTTQ